MSDQVALSSETSKPELAQSAEVENPKETYSISENNPLYDLFEVPEKSNKLNEVLGKIWSWAQEQSANKDRESVLFEVIRLKNRLGEASIGEKPWARVLNYISIANRVNEDTKRLEEMRK